MRSFSWLNVVMVGLIVLLAVLLVESNSADNQARAAGTSGVSGGVIAVTGRFDQFGDVLYLIDTNHQTLLTYAFHRSSGGASRSFERGKLRLLAGRTFKWDSLAAEKVTIGSPTTPTTADTKKEALRNR